MNQMNHKDEELDFFKGQGMLILSFLTRSNPPLALDDTRLVTSISGDTFYTTPKFHREILDFIQQRGRTNMLEISRSLDVDYTVVDTALHALLKETSQTGSKNTLYHVNGEWMMDSYMDEISHAMQTALRDRGFVLLKALCDTYRLPSSSLEPLMYKLLNSFQDQEVTIDTEHKFSFTKKWLAQLETDCLEKMSKTKEPIGIHDLGLDPDIPLSFAGDRIDSVFPSLNLKGRCVGKGANLVYYPQDFYETQLNELKSVYLSRGWIDAKEAESICAEMHTTWNAEFTDSHLIGRYLISSRIMIELSFAFEEHTWVDISNEVDIPLSNEETKILFQLTGSHIKGPDSSWIVIRDGLLFHETFHKKFQSSLNRVLEDTINQQRDNAKKTKIVKRPTMEMILQLVLGDELIVQSCLNEEHVANAVRYDMGFIQSTFDQMKHTAHLSSRQKATLDILQNKIQYEITRLKCASEGLSVFDPKEEAKIVGDLGTYLGVSLGKPFFNMLLHRERIIHVKDDQSIAFPDFSKLLTEEEEDSLYARIPSEHVDFLERLKSYLNAGDISSILAILEKDNVLGLAPIDCISDIEPFMSNHRTNLLNALEAESSLVMVIHLFTLILFHILYPRRLFHASGKFIPSLLQHIKIRVLDGTTSNADFDTSISMDVVRQAYAALKHGQKLVMAVMKGQGNPEEEKNAIDTIKALVHRLGS